MTRIALLVSTVACALSTRRRGLHAKTLTSKHVTQRAHPIKTIPKAHSPAHSVIAFFYTRHFRRYVISLFCVAVSLQTSSLLITYYNQTIETGQIKHYKQ